VQVLLTKNLPGGQVQVATEVGDFQLLLPGAAVVNTRVNVLGRLVIGGGRSFWSEPVELVLDATAPQIERVRLDPGSEVPLGKPLKLTFAVSELNLSGVAKIQVGFAAPGGGKFAPDPPAVEATSVDGLVWSAEFPADMLKEGSHTLLIQAQDQVGNLSQFTKIPLRVVSATDSTPPVRPNNIVGVVRYGRQIIPGAMVTVQSVDKPEAPPITRQTGDQGEFAFKQLPPGKYKITATGQARNRRRKAEEEVTVVAAPAPEVNLMLQVR